MADLKTLRVISRKEMRRRIINRRYFFDAPRLSYIYCAWCDCMFMKHTTFHAFCCSHCRSTFFNHIRQYNHNSRYNGNSKLVAGTFLAKDEIMDHQIVTLPAVHDRRPFGEGSPDLYLENDAEFVQNNFRECLWFLEHHHRLTIKEIEMGVNE